jgi:putative holliday junction resolvase
MNPSPQPKKRLRRFVGVDYGTRRLGLALSDERGILATPLEVLQAGKKTEQTIVKLLTLLSTIQQKYECDIEEIIVGLPLMMNGRSGFLADEVQHFVSLLAQATSIPVRTWDERLSTVQAERSLREGRMTRKKRTTLVDKVSAAIILQNYLDHKHFSNNRPNN